MKNAWNTQCVPMSMLKFQTRTTHECRTELHIYHPDWLVNKKNTKFTYWFLIITAYIWRQTLNQRARLTSGRVVKSQSRQWSIYLLSIITDFTNPSHQLYARNRSTYKNSCTYNGNTANNCEVVNELILHFPITTLKSLWNKIKTILILAPSQNH